MVDSLDKALKLAQNDGEVMGGTSFYQQILPMADRLYITEVSRVFEGSVYFPEFVSNDFEEVSRQAYF